MFSERDLHCIEFKFWGTSPIPLTTELHFQSKFEQVTAQRCPHTKELDEDTRVGDYDFIDESDGYNTRCLSFFEILSRNAKSLLQRFRDDQLSSFRYVFLSIRDFII